MDGERGPLKFKLKPPKNHLTIGPFQAISAGEAESSSAKG
jgi:hypothetical protein